MNGADLLCKTLLQENIDVCFANPGTSEMHFVAALDKRPEMRCVLGLFEGVLTGAADGYARMSSKPAATLLHLGPGLANSLANLHNAKRARVPMVNIVGDHASYHDKYDAPLSSDVYGLAHTMSHWVHRIAGPDGIVAATQNAVHAATTAPGSIATLILPADAAWAPIAAGSEYRAKPRATARLVEHATITKIAALLRNGKRTMLLLGGRALRADSLDIAGKISSHSTIRILAETLNQRIERGAGRTPITRLPYGIDSALAVLKDVEQLILVDARDPVAFFAYPNKPGRLAPPACDVHVLSSTGEDPVQALAGLADELGIPAHATGLAAPALIPALRLEGVLTANAVCHLVAHYLPEHAIVCDESITAGLSFSEASLGSAPHDHLQLTGGAIGIGLPLAVGAAIACPTRKVISLQADGSGMYTLQALWTQAREKLNCLTIILANRTYATLHGEMKHVGVTNPGHNALRMLDLTEPNLDWPKLAQGMGVDGVRTDTVREFHRALQYGLQQEGPYLIEAVI
ncbi:acetolactate synthase large subunit [Alcaligenaceae bacterium]|nr:acetolactate synthase large subunit [Alcaligenaceae bacterium]